MTPKQHDRQSHRGRDGRYAEVNPCYHCGKSAGVDYCSHYQTDRLFDDEGLCLCGSCCEFLQGLPDEEALRRLRLSDYGSNPQKCE